MDSKRLLIGMRRESVSAWNFLKICPNSIDTIELRQVSGPVQYKQSRE